MTSYDKDVVSLLTQLVHELRAENALLKSEIFKKSAIASKSRTSDLASQIASIESGNVVQR